ncbi:ADP-ribosyltransferase [Microbacterium phage Ramiel05]|uniref:ADP-ribosyltransferase n=2 Tax=Quhwahvirus TaxID=2733202 RepID=A0A7L7SUN4_9CAUD|nr:hypothetical protein HOT74_gp53 [Microbacterium phage KaiHaiDragon]QOC58077.1 ADP-ribosyltransferase [Microbacterium phage Scumberland]UQT01886.1 ADP-ribosyltransferase [Microbacterium phage Savannah]URM86261.1 ADP-ribosyltransferase [Microbacterium phage Kowalski]URM86870.1 ADP-ribosyltransferase [Microbacterium phage Ramiel05]UVG34528.1 ADP-ribosyltransferase [Microbacterium phage EarickHC]UVK58626.1 ADP-ribosyltransferase [Microbacterium phage CrazyRich]UXE04629.1 ADP-ribosyltransferas
MTTWWHGGRFPADGLLIPQPMMRSGRPGDGWVYITSERDLAATYAATLRGAWLMQVEPVGDIEPDPESRLDTSFRCRSARVLRRYTLSRAELEQRRAVMASLGIAP